MVEALQSNVWAGMEFRTESRPLSMASKRGTASFGNTSTNATGGVCIGGGEGDEGGDGGSGVGYQETPPEEDGEEVVSLFFMGARKRDVFWKNFVRAIVALAAHTHRHK